MQALVIISKKLFNIYRKYRAIFIRNAVIRNTYLQNDYKYTKVYLDEKNSYIIFR